MPEPLGMAWRTRRFGLPRAGGWLDQDAGDVQRMEIAEEAYMVAMEYLQLPAGAVADWIDQNPRKWELIESLDE